MPRLLLITTAYPPPPSSGAARLTRMLNWLPSYGYDCTVLTIARDGLPPGTERLPDDPQYIYRVAISTSRRGSGSSGCPVRTSTRKLGSFTAFRRLVPFRLCLRRLAYNFNPFNFPDPVRAWIPKGVRQGLSLAANRPFDLIYSSASGPGISAHFIAARLAAQLRVPWVHEYRDLWTGNPWRGLRPYWWREWLERSWERYFLKIADGAVVMNRSNAEILAAHHRAVHPCQIHVVPNGYDAGEHTEGASPPITLPLRLVYTGALYGGKRDLSALFSGLRQLLDDGEWRRDEVEFCYAGTDGRELRAMASRAGLESIVYDRGVIPAQEARRLQQSAHLLILAEAADDNPWIQGNVPGKAYEYLGARRPVLALAHPEGAIAQLYQETHAGVTIHPNDTSRIREHLRKAISTLRSKGRLDYSPDEAKVNACGWPVISRQLANILDAARKRYSSRTLVADAAD